MDYSSFAFPVVFDFSQTFETFNWKIIDLFSFFDHKKKISASLQSHIGNRELPNGGVLRRKQCKFLFRISPSLKLISNFLRVFFDFRTKTSSLRIQVPVCLTTVDTFWTSFFFIGSISVFFLLPLLILIVLYSVIAKHLMINPSLISAQGNRSNFIKYRKQVILMLAAVVISFFTCLLPFRAFTLWIIFVPSDTIISFLSTEKGKFVPLKSLDYYVDV